MIFRRRITGDGALPFVRRRPTTNPILPVIDMDEAVAFYEDLGFRVKKYDDGYAWVSHCGWEWFHLGRTDGPVGPGAGAYLHVDDVDAWHAAMTATATQTSVPPPETKPWGMREFAVVDPAGNVIRIGQAL